MRQSEKEDVYIDAYRLAMDVQNEDNEGVLFLHIKDHEAKVVFGGNWSKLTNGIVSSMMAKPELSDIFLSASDWVIDNTIACPACGMLMELDKIKESEWECPKCRSIVRRSQEPPVNLNFIQKLIHHIVNFCKSFFFRRSR